MRTNRQLEPVEFAKLDFRDKKIGRIRVKLRARADEVLDERCLVPLRRQPADNGVGNLRMRCNDEYAAFSSLHASAGSKVNAVAARPTPLPIRRRRNGSKGQTSHPRGRLPSGI